jgi:RNA polymerase sigma-70 factor, ECF subfamily
MTTWPRSSAPASSASEAREGTPAPALDGLLAEGARAGDPAAFRALYEHFAPMVHAVLLSHARAQDADDLMQDVFLSAWRGLHRLQRDEHLGGWLAVIARNRARRAHTRAPPATEALLDEPPDPASLGAQRGEGAGSGWGAAPGEARDAAEAALALLSRLPQAYRETLAMRLVEGLTGPQIAAATGLTHGSVRVNLTRGMKLYKELLRQHGWP